MMFDLNQVKEFLPHRDPFLFVDSVETLKVNGVVVTKNDYFDVKDLVGGEVLAHYYTKKDHPIFAGHFPGNPILPGVVQIEMMAQAGSFVMTRILNEGGPLKMEVVLASVTNAKFRNPVYPDMHLVLKSVCKKIRGPMISQECSLFHEDKLMSEATVMASLKFN